MLSQAIACVQSPFLVWEPQTIFFLRTTRLRIVALIDEVSAKGIHIEEKIKGNFLTCGLRVA